MRLYMSNGIATRQNKEANIARLAAQRQLYRDVNSIEIANVILTVLIPAGFAILQDLTGKGKIVACILSFIMLVSSFMLDNWQKEKKKLAASIQQEFDICVYTMKWDSKLFGKRKNLDVEIAKASKKILGNEKERNLLENWYRKEVDALPLEEGIAACQKENFSWDAGLRKRYRSFLYRLLAVIFGVQICIGIRDSETIEAFLFRLLSFSSTLKWILKNLFGIYADLNRMEAIEQSVYSTEKKTMEELQFTQKEILENRKAVTKIPDWFYKIFRNNDEDRERRALEIR